MTSLLTRKAAALMVAAALLAPAAAEATQRPDSTLFNGRDIGCTGADIGAIANHYAVPTPILYTLLNVEGGSIGTVSRNTDGSFDHGPMQINSVHFDEIHRITGLSAAQLRQKLVHDGCWNIGIGAWLFSRHWFRTGDFWTAVGNYNSKTPHKHARYVRKVVRAAQELYGAGVFNPQVPTKPMGK